MSRIKPGSGWSRFLPACSCFAVLVLPVDVAFCTSLVEGHIQGWKSTYSEPESDPACQSSAIAAIKCAQQSAKHSADFLDKLIGQVAQRIPQAERRLFQRAERQWRLFSNASCAFEAAGAKDQKQLVNAECAHAYNVRRITLLSKYEYCLAGGTCSSDYSLFLISAWEQ